MCWQYFVSVLELSVCLLVILVLVVHSPSPLIYIYIHTHYWLLDHHASESNLDSPVASRPAALVQKMQRLLSQTEGIWCTPQSSVLSVNTL